MNLENINLKPLKEEINKFLTKHCVLENNYNGYIEGTIGSKGLKWSSYNSDNYLTKTQVRKFADDLDKKLTKIKNEIMPEDIEVTIVFETDRDGGGSIFLELYQTRKEHVGRKRWNDSAKGQATAYDNEEHYKESIK